MIKLIAPALIAGLFGAAGGAAAVYLKSSSGAPAEHSVAKSDEGGHGAEAKDDGHGSKPKKEKDDHGAKKGGHGDSAAAGEPSYYKFSREFVVPIIENNRVQSLVILNLNLQVSSAASQNLFSKEPALRDNIMATLIALSGDDTVFNSLNNIDHYETIRSMVLANLQDAFSTDIQNVLILDMARQDL